MSPSALLADPLGTLPLSPMMTPIPVYIGFDERETIAFHVLAHSIHSRASAPVSVTPVMLSQLGAVWRREKNNLQSTDFSFSRFLVPWLCGYKGWAIFMDCDILVVDDIAKLWNLRDERYAVMCVQHDHQPQDDVKFLGAVQTRYAKKNWTSVMLINCARCTALTPEYVNTATGLELHQFKWLEGHDAGDPLVGALPLRWNHLVDYNPAQPVGELSALHYTEGGPYFEAYQDCGYAQNWCDERERMLYAQAKPTGQSA